MEVKRFVDYCWHIGTPLILGCVSNTDHTLWSITKKGADLLNISESKYIEILKLGNTPTFRNATRAEILNITVFSTSIKDQILKWSFFDKSILLNHEHVRFEVRRARKEGMTGISTAKSWI